MAANEKEAYLALIAAHDPEIRTLLDHGFAFVTTPSRQARRRPACRPGRIGTTCEGCNKTAIRWK